MIAPLLLAAAPAVGVGYSLTTDSTLLSLRDLEVSSSLTNLRAGAPVTHTFAEADRAALQRADQKVGDLVEMRGGALSDHELLIIGITALAVLLLIIIL